MTCAQVQELAAELALGSVWGTERAAALAHIAGCASCRTLQHRADRLASYCYRRAFRPIRARAAGAFQELSGASDHAAGHHQHVLNTA